MGELMLFYAAADIAFVGGSFSGTGGHNPLEPAALGLPVIMGPDCFNFQSITDALSEASGLVRVADTAELQTQLSIWLEDADQRCEAGQQAAAFVAANRGALDRLESHIGRFISATAGPPQC